MVNASRPPVSQLGAVILAGGRGTRLPDKCFRMLGDKQLIVHVFERISQVTQEIVVSVKSKEQATRIRRLIHPAQVVLDRFEVQAPLVGFLSGLRAIRSPYVFASACDLAFIEPNIIRELFQRAHDSDGAIPTDGELLEPLCAAYCREVALRAAEKSFERGEMSMLDMLTRLTRLVRVPLESLREVDPQLLSFRNINTGQDFAWATKMIQTRSADNL